MHTCKEGRHFWACVSAHKLSCVHVKLSCNALVMIRAHGGHGHDQGHLDSRFLKPHQPHCSVCTTVSAGDVPQKALAPLGAFPLGAFAFFSLQKTFNTLAPRLGLKRDPREASSFCSLRKLPFSCFPGGFPFSALPWLPQGLPPLTRGP